ncbi:fructosamine kinase family protein [Seonamhaeicola maritimus]|uniref:Fructosamine kinase family protein n=1 Tax=Seonamhaeicola maritimus TaxID=2591822 RepID=A0A5C7GF78_9FLAO|nr:fructosamine kinase family protein [Seonamhaeicola maritimus]TXG35246.1 fructosamine kinase family protein [Seonamhaeicola maritimus]
MNKGLKLHLSNLLEDTIINVSSIGGGDISRAYKADTSNCAYFLKMNSVSALNIFKTEAYGLDLIAKTNTIKTPNIIAFGKFENASFLLMDFIESKRASAEDYEILGEQLAALHKCTSENFGLDKDNYIGSLPQSNTTHNTWVEFYTYERLLPQLEIAKQIGLLSGSESPPEQRIIGQLESLFNGIKPSLLHGDLWSGNYLISKVGEPYLIDPAVYYGHNEVDIAMTKLFGGFGNTFYESYHSHFPSYSNTSARIEIYQLYYLLVHLNLFGSSYYGSVVTILNKYF